MIGIYINFNSQSDLEKVEDDLDRLSGYEVGGNSPDEPVWLLCYHSPESEDDEDNCHEYEEAQEIRAEAEALLKQQGINYSITESA